MTTDSASMQGSRIFISYRREDSELAASRLAEDLRRHFAPAQVFQDFASIDPGADFVDAVQRGLDTCAAVLVVIGSKWLNVVDKKERRRLDVPGDWVRHEVAESLRRPAVRVFPVLLDHAEMPGVEDLPEDLQALTRRQAFPLTVRHWGKDVAELVEHLRRVPGLDRRCEVGPLPVETRAPEPGAPAAAVSGAAGPRSPVVVRERVAAAASSLPGSVAQGEQRAEDGPQEEERRDESRQRAIDAGEPGTGGAVAARWKPIAAISAAVAIALVVFARYAGQESHPGPVPVPAKPPEVTLVEPQGPVPAAASAPATEQPAEIRTPAVASGVPPPPPTVGEAFRDCDQCPEMVVVPGGSFMMGSPETEGSAEERPQHRVTFERPFAVGKYELTFDEWDACVADRGCNHKPDDRGWERGRQPVIDVSWDDAQAYVAWLAKKTGKPYRLLSEAEWEYAARAGSTTAYPWGKEPGRNRANFDGSGSQWSGKQTAPVGSFAPNAFGLYDMIGNVWESTQDCWNGSYAGAPMDGLPWLKGHCGRRVARGGFWDSTPGGARAAFRFWVEPGSRSSLLGFRLARTL
ncbi:SUMF1/EgtB/PvdO family nonheme iron enzyme [Accumulibacter sp.]|uniref:SUMF1/EgtB/PvdO family nonheme iron enzyme n=1 Tax=Accumulibacter sp. TaxID=2053492 RepID=UPI001AD04F2F|nr:SUMF1/EgtB/PvdO family nonheme iron enzyme [Accumulibacter sp.]MBN8454297.1 SUMF1/EgtB/PvdO family nonheme iron enzyme [Accumulibacter sp.]